MVGEKHGEFSSIPVYVVPPSYFARTRYRHSNSEYNLERQKKWN